MELELVPVRTRILTHKDDIAAVIKEYAADVTDKDIICTAESVLAITQGRYVRPEELSPTWQARLMNRFVPAAGTMPPFDKCIVYGPADADEVCERIVKETGAYGAVVADVNDLKRAAVLGKSGKLDPKKIAKILIDNPFGNASQKTPIVIIKNFKDAEG